MEWNEYSLTDNHLPDFSFIPLISLSKTNVELHPKLKLTNILKFKLHYLFTTILLHILCLCTCWENYLSVDTFDYRLFVNFTTLLCSVRCIVCNCLWLNYLTLVLTKKTWSWSCKKSLIYISGRRWNKNAVFYTILFSKFDSSVH